MNAHLYDMAEQYVALLDVDDYTDEVADELEKLSDSIQQKAGNIAGFVESTTDTIAALKEREKAIAAHRKSLENRVEWLKHYLKNNMEACGITKIEWGTHRITLAKNPPRVVVDDEFLLPDEYKEIVTTTKVDKKAVGDALKNGEAVEGAHLEHGFSVRIK